MLDISVKMIQQKTVELRESDELAMCLLFWYPIHQKSTNNLCLEKRPTKEVFSLQGKIIHVEIVWYEQLGFLLLPLLLLLLVLLLSLWLLLLLLLLSLPWLLWLLLVLSLFRLIVMIIVVMMYCRCMVHTVLGFDRPNISYNICILQSQTMIIICWY